jgi:hypothetical protein
MSWDDLWVPSSCLKLEDGICRLSCNVGNYQSTLRSVPEERRSPKNDCYRKLRESLNPKIYNHITICPEHFCRSLSLSLSLSHTHTHRVFIGPYHMWFWWWISLLLLTVDCTVEWNSIGRFILVSNSQQTTVLHHFPSWTVSNPIDCLDGSSAGKITCNCTNNHDDWFCATSQQSSSSVGLIPSKTFLYMKTVTWSSDAANDSRRLRGEEIKQLLHGRTFWRKVLICPPPSLINFPLFATRFFIFAVIDVVKVTHGAWLTRISYLSCFFHFTSCSAIMTVSCSYPTRNLFVFFNPSFSICLILCAFILHRWYLLL